MGNGIPAQTDGFTEYEVFGLGRVPEKGESENEIKLFISKEHRFGTDSLLLGEFAGEAKDATVADLCSGCGVIAVMLCRRNPPRKVYAVEIQAEAAALIRKTAAENNLDGILEVVEGDLRDAETLSRIGQGQGKETVDLVTANPPYYVKKSGFERNSNPQKAARYETDCTLSDAVKAAGRLLKFGGELKMCMTASRLCECIGIMREHSIEPKEIVLIPAKNNMARLFLISGKKGAKSGVAVSWKS